MVINVDTANMMKQISIPYDCIVGKTKRTEKLEISKRVTDIPVQRGRTGNGKSSPRSIHGTGPTPTPYANTDKRTQTNTTQLYMTLSWITQNPNPATIIAKKYMNKHEI